MIRLTKILFREYDGGSNKIRREKGMAEVRARVKLKVGRKSNVEADMLSFRGLKTEKEHLAVIFRTADQNQTTPLVRMHSECLTGDVFHSSRCDCGEQLEETIDKMEKEGGIILYLRQEGRGIGLYNKIDAYHLQSQGMNTYEANNALGFHDDLRDFEEAAQMLMALSVSTVRLITNNPKKIRDLDSYGVEVVQVVNTSAHVKQDNESYLKAKISHGRHDIKL